MRPAPSGTRTLSVRSGAVAAVASAVALIAPGVALADNQHGPKIDDRVAQAAAMTSSTTAIPVIVFGNQSARLDPSLHSGVDLGLATAGTVPAGQLDAVAADPNVAFVAPDVLMEPCALAGDRGGKALSPASLKALYALVDDAPAAWSAGYAGNGVGIAVIDSGIDDGSLGNRLVLPAGTRHDADRYGHGTLVAHFAAGNLNGQYVGIAPQANVIDVAVGRRDGSVYTSDLVAGLMWVLANKSQFNIRVVTISLTETTPSSYATSFLDSVVELLWRSGIVVVTAAGNNGPGAEEFAPANDPFAITVGATDSQGTADPSDDTVTPWSSSGLTLDGIPKPDLVAPGRLVPGYLPYATALARQAPRQNWVADRVVEISGTSFSAPQVAGAAADVLQAHPDWTPDQVKTVLESSGRPQAGSLAPALDVGAAVLTQGSPVPANPGVPYAQLGTSPWVNTALQIGPSGLRGLLSLPGLHTLAAWSAAGWNAAGWNAAGWNAGGWNAAGWNAAGWNAAGWNAASWNAFGWS